MQQYGHIRRSYTKTMASEGTGLESQWEGNLDDDARTFLQGLTGWSGKRKQLEDGIWKNKDAWKTGRMDEGILIKRQCY